MVDVERRDSEAASARLNARSFGDVRKLSSVCVTVHGRPEGDIFTRPAGAQNGCATWAPEVAALTRAFIRVVGHIVGDNEVCFAIEVDVRKRSGCSPGLDGNTALRCDIFKTIPCIAPQVPGSVPGEVDIQIAIIVDVAHRATLWRDRCGGKQRLG